MVIVDLSHILSDDMQIYPGDPIYKSTCHSTVENDDWAIRSISLGSHTGTHVDAPSHYILSGQNIDQIPLDVFTGPAIVVDLTAKKANEPIDRKELVPYISPNTQPGMILLLHTGWSKHWNTPEYLEYPFLTREAVEYILQSGVKLVGVDTLSPDSIAGPYHAHQLILGAGKIIAENLTNLDLISNGKWTVSMMPLALKDTDGSPVRAYATETQ